MKYLFILFLFLNACASNKIIADPTAANVSSDYMDIVEKYSDKARRYSGFYNTLDIEATIVNSTVAQAQLTLKKSLSQWDESKINDEKLKLENKLNKETELFLSFFTPERRNNDLLKTNTMWKLFLDVEGRRYEGKVTKIKNELVEVQALYPYHNRFYTPYTVTFPVPLKSIENKAVKFTITSAVGSATLNFNP